MSGRKIIVSDQSLRFLIEKILSEASQERQGLHHSKKIIPLVKEVGGYYAPGMNPANPTFAPEQREESSEEKEKRQNREQIARGQIPVGVKLATEDEGEPKVVKVGYASLGGKTLSIGKVYSKALKSGFDIIPGGASNKYGSLIPVDFITKGTWTYPERFVYVSDALVQAGNQGEIEKIEGEEVDAQSIIAKAPALRKNIAERGAKAFYDAKHLFAMNEIYDNVWFPPTMKSTAAGITRSQEMKCSMSKREFGKAIIDFGSGKYLDYVNIRTGGLLGYLAGKEKFYDDEEFNRVAPCFAAVADSFIYDVAAGILGAMVGAVASPAAGAGTYATLQLTPMVPVLMWHIQKKNWQSAIFYIVRMIAAVYGGASTQVVKQIVAAVVEVLASLASDAGYAMSDAEKQIILSWFTGKTISQAVAAAALIRTNDPQGLVSLYPNL